MRQAEKSERPAPEWDLAEARRIVTFLLEGYQADVYLFGSAARGAMTPHSDIDIAVYAKEPLPVSLMAEIREALENSNILYNVDVVDMNAAPPELRTKIQNQGHLWKG
jgi:predicted nucleotidyltransferase